MPDFPAAPAGRPFGIIGPIDAASSTLGELLVIQGSSSANGVWPSANLAIYCPVVVERAVTVYQMAINVATQSGNVDVGIYDEPGNRLVSAGSTAVGAAGVQLFNITDTALSPGCYWIAMVASSGTASFTRFAPTAAGSRACSVRQQATALPLPATATFADMAQVYVPHIAVSTVATI